MSTLSENPQTNKTNLQSVEMKERELEIAKQAIKDKENTVRLKINEEIKESEKNKAKELRMQKIKLERFDGGEIAQKLIKEAKNPEECLEKINQTLQSMNYEENPAKYQGFLLYSIIFTGEIGKKFTENGYPQSSRTRENHNRMIDILSEGVRITKGNRTEVGGIIKKIAEAVDEIQKTGKLDDNQMDTFAKNMGFGDQNKPNNNNAKTIKQFTQTAFQS